MNAGQRAGLRSDPGLDHVNLRVADIEAVCHNAE
jgi:hypothetical protein